jgi:uncharacterized membrane protein
MLGGGNSIQDQISGNLPSSAATTLKINWLFSLFMIAAVLGMVAGLHGMKSGWLIAAGNIGGIVLSLAVAEFGRWLAIGGIIAGVLVVAAMILRNRQFLFQSVKSVEKLKEALPDAKGVINDTFFLEQNRTTEKMVQFVKSKLDRRSSKDKQKEEAAKRAEARKKQEAFYSKYSKSETQHPAIID